jgi:hypothetical protein
VPAQLLLDKRALRLPSRWLARGLARDGWTHSEAVYWHQYWGLQGLNIPFSTKPMRAPHVALRPRREAGDALLLRFSGGAVKPWLKRCGGPTASGVPMCGRSGFDCAKLWLRQISEEALRAIEAPEAGPALALSVASADVLGVRRACVTDLALRKRADEMQALVFDADSAFGPRGMARVAVAGGDAQTGRGGAHGAGRSSDQRGGSSRSAAAKGNGPRESSSHQPSSHQSSSHHSHASSSSPHHSSPARQSHSPSFLHRAASARPTSSPRQSHAPSAGGAASAVGSHSSRSSAHPSSGGGAGSGGGRPSGSGAGRRVGSAGDRGGGATGGSRHVG